jgi:prenyltransferase beta subunit
MKRLRESGGEDRAERAVRNGLEFITKKQNKDGSFGEEYHGGITGLALLAYLGHCETPESPKFGDSVVKAAVFLIDRCRKNDGRITNGKKGHHEAYEHAIAPYALAELYTMTKESGKEIPRLESTLRKAVGVIVDAQTNKGGWPYGFHGEGKEDMSVGGWQIQALKAAYNTGRNFSGVERALDYAVEDYLPKIQDSQGAFKYNPDHAKGKPTLTGAALLALQIWKGMDTPTYKRGFEYLTNTYSNPSPGANYYAPYYNTQVFFMAEGKQWENYNKKFQPRLLDAQNKDGSWLADGGNRKDNQLLNTAWAILMLEVYYRYLPTTDKVNDLKPR